MHGVLWVITQYPLLGVNYTDTGPKRTILQKSIDFVSWYPFPLAGSHRLSPRQMMAISQVINDLDLDPVAVAWGMYGTCDLLGLRFAAGQILYLIDNTCAVTPVRLDTPEGSVGSTLISKLGLDRNGSPRPGASSLAGKHQ
jgi:hypothetical protein